MRKDDLYDIFKDISILTKNGDLPKKTFLHPESDKDYYKRSSAGDILGKSRKNLSFVVPFEKMGERLGDVFWKKLKSMLLNLKSFDSKKIIEALEKEYLDSTKPDEKKQKEFVQHMTVKRMEEMNLEQNRQIKNLASVWTNLTSEQVNKLLNLAASFQQENTNKLVSQQALSSTEDNKQRTKTKAELKDTSKSMSSEESTSRDR
jgi:hypothetical protein